MEENKIPIAKETIIRGVLIAVAIVNEILTAKGKNPIPFSDETIYSFLSYMFLIGAMAWGYWKNNNFTQAALEAQELLDAIKEEDKAAREERME